MRIPRIFTAHPLAQDARIELEPAASHHLVRVLRMGVGRALTVFNGEGGEYTAEIIAIGKKNVTLEISHFYDINNNSTLVTELAIGISRNDKLDWVLQKATELGVSRIIPLNTLRTENKLKGDREEKKWQHWQQIIISACEQSGRNIIPELLPLTHINDYIPKAMGEFKYVLHHRNTNSFTTRKPPESISLLIGPEGGLSDDEINTALNAGFAPLTLGPRILRTETAPLAVLSLVQFLWGDLKD